MESRKTTDDLVNMLRNRTQEKLEQSRDLETFELKEIATVLGILKDKGY